QDVCKQAGVRLGDLVRYEFHGQGHEVAWSNRTGGMDVQLNPCPGLLYRLYRPGAEGEVPHHVCELPLAAETPDGKKPSPFWRHRHDTQLPVPLLFAARPGPQADAVTLDARHPGLSLSFVHSPYDRCVVLSSPDCLVLVRARIVVRSEWLAVDLRLYNLH